MRLLGLSFIIAESQGAFIFMIENNQDINKESLPVQSEMDYWKPVMRFYIKTTSWIILPLILCLLLINYIGKSISSQLVFFVIILLGFFATCFGIYREIKNYKKGLDVPFHKAKIDEYHANRKDTTI